MAIALRDGSPDDAVGLAPVFAAFGYPVEPATLRGRLNAMFGDVRGAGAGRLLVAAAEAHFVERGLARIEVTSGDNHAAAHSFYRHLGYTDNGIRFAKTLT